MIHMTFHAHLSNLGCTYIVQRGLWKSSAVLVFFLNIYCSTFVIFSTLSFSFLLCSNWTGTYFVHSSLYFSCSHWKRWHRNNFIHSISIWFDLIFAFMFTTWRTDLRAEKIVRRVFWFDLIFAFMFTTWRTDLRAEKIVRRVFWTCHNCKI